MLAGPSEILIAADDSANPTYLAADLLSQAEHDPLACAILITDSERVANAVGEEIEVQLAQLLWLKLQVPHCSRQARLSLPRICLPLSKWLTFPHRSI